MASQLVIDGQMIELEDTIQYTFNTGNIADMSLSKSNYTEAFNIPKISLQAVRLFNGLGIPAHISGTPYQIKNVDVLDEYCLVYTANLILLETTEDFYKATAISGTYDIFSLMGNKTFADIPAIGLTLPLKTPSKVAEVNALGVGSVRQFAIANYGGVTHVNYGSDIRINVDCMAISYNIKYLWDNIFQHIGVDQSVDPFGKNFEVWNFTFPYPPLNEMDAFGDSFFRGDIPESYQNLSGTVNPNIYNGWINVIEDGFTVLSSGALRCDSPSIFNFTFNKFYAYGQGNVGGTNRLFPLNIILKKNGTEFYRFQASMNDTDGEGIFANAIETFNTGDQLTIQAEKTVNIDSGANWNFFTFQSTLRIRELEISAAGVNEVLGYKLSDYVKEFMNRYGLIGFLRNQKIDFIDIKTILESVPIDWSDKYHKRTSQIYDIGWSQNNYLKHSYVNEGSDYYDLNIISQNLNTPPERTVIQSKVFVPSQNNANFSLGGSASTGDSVSTRAYITYSADNNNKIKTEKRNFWQRLDLLSSSYTAVFGSLAMTERVASTGAITVADDTYDVYFKISPEWASMTKVVEFPQQDTIELNLTIADIVGLDQSRLYYFKQEAAYFMLSGLSYKYGQIAIGKFNKVIR